MKRFTLKSFVVLIWFLCVIYSALIVLLSALGIGSIYTQRRADVMSRCAYLLYEEQRAYKQKDENFWAVYARIYNDAEALGAFRAYYAGGDEPKPYERTALVETMRALMDADGDIQWILLYRGEGSYILHAGSSILERVAEDFPYWEAAKGKRERMETYGYRGIPGIYAVAGGGIDSAGGALMIGYRTALYEKLYAVSDMRRVANIQISIGGEVVYQSIGEGERPLLETQFEQSESGVVRASDGRRYDVQAIVHTGRGYQVALLVDHAQLARMAGRDIPPLIGVMLALIGVTIAMYSFLSRRVMHRVRAISGSLTQLGQNNFEVPVERYDPGDEFDQIAGAVERTRDQLKLSMRETMQAVASRKQAEMTALQARFNPHFLFNTIEVIRGRLQAQGDDESALMLGEMTRIFRTLLSVKPSVTVREELSFCRSYIQLLKIRKKQNLSVTYDVDEEALDCPLIRNILQPLIENCVVHGVADGEKCAILIEVRLKADCLELTVANDGAPIPPDQLERIRSRLAGGGEDGDQGYGIYGIARRLKVIYEDAAWLDIQSGEGRDTRVTLHVPRAEQESGQ